jgi:1-acyl-sn-glycerol-3-phosphate acyltransferase
MKNFEKKKMLEIFKMDIEETVDYFTKLRQYNYENNNPIELVQFRRKIHSLLINAIKIDRMLNKETITILNDRRKNNNKPIIYTATHIGGQDIERIAEAIKDHSYIFIGDPKELYKDLAGLILYLNGVIYIQTDNKIDRKIGKERSIEVLKNNDNLLIFPEATWNFSDNKLVLGLFNGAVDMAMLILFQLLLNNIIIIILLILVTTYILVKLLDKLVQKMFMELKIIPIKIVLANLLMVQLLDHICISQ